VISWVIEGVDSGTWKAVRKVWEKAASWFGSRPRIRSWMERMVGGSRGIRGRGSRELCSHRLSRRALGGWPLRRQRGATHLAAG
jgi:hypothetical protein